MVLGRGGHSDVQTVRYLTKYMFPNAAQRIVEHKMNIY